MRYTLFITVLTSFKLFSLTTINDPKNMLWFGYFQQLKLKPKWSLSSDIQFRTRDAMKTYSQALFRTGLNYTINEKVSITAGFAHFRFFITNSITRSEWRPWQEIGYNNEFNKIKIKQRLRMEQRFNETAIDKKPSGNFQFNWRFRYKMELSYLIGKIINKECYFTLGNEVMINVGKAIKKKIYDQNRLAIGFILQISNQLLFQPQYMYINQYNSKINTTENYHVLRLNLIHKL